MKPTDSTQMLGPWWTRKGVPDPYDGAPPAAFRTATCNHPHWAEPRLPGRKVSRAQAAHRGAFKPTRRYHSKRRTGPIGRIFNSGALPLIPSFLNNFVTSGRKGDDR